MPATPFQVTFTVNDDSGAALQNAVVLVRNCTKKSTSATQVTNSSGQAIIDLANLPVISPNANPYDAGDILLLVAYKGNQHDGIKYTVTGSSKSQTLQMNSVPFNPTAPATQLLSCVAANTAGAAGTATFWAFGDGEKLAKFQVPATDTKNHTFGPKHGKPCHGGFIIERSATTMDVTVNTL